MKKKINNYIIKRIDEEYLHTSEVLWNSEIDANIFVAKMMLISAGLLIACYILDVVGIFSVDNYVFFQATVRGCLELVLPAVTCFVLKGRKKWIKSVLMIFFTFAMFRIVSILGYSVTLLVVLPTVISTKYYSRVFTNSICVLSTLLIGLSYFVSIANGNTIDLNYLSLPSGTVLTIEDTFRKTILNSGFDKMSLWHSFLKQGFLPMFIHYSLTAAVCSSIAYNGRKMIFEEKSQTEKTAKISADLNLASDIQTNMLPNIFPAFPNRNDFDIYASMKPAKEVGGDFYDYFMIDEDHIAIVIADVSGKGVPAAMFMVIAKTLIKDHTLLGLSPSEVFTKVNNLLCEGNKSGLFVTAWMGVVELSTGEMTYVNAGHNPPVLCHNGKNEYLRSKAGFVLAGLEDFKYKQNTMKLVRGDKIFLYTDGITESQTKDGELYGEDRLLKCLNNLEHKNVTEAIYAVKSDINEFVEDGDQFDDMTMLAFDYSEKSENKIVERTFKANDKELHNVLAYVEEQLEQHDCSMKDQMMISVMVEELFVNIAHYAYPDKEGDAMVGMKFENGIVTIALQDSGIPFNPLEKEDPDITLSAEDREIGGLGIFMVKKSMDSVEYKRIHGDNVIIFTKDLKHGKNR